MTQRRGRLNRTRFWVTGRLDQPHRCRCWRAPGGDGAAGGEEGQRQRSELCEGRETMTFSVRTKTQGYVATLRFDGGDLILLMGYGASKK